MEGATVKIALDKSTYLIDHILKLERLGMNNNKCNNAILSFHYNLLSDSDNFLYFMRPKNDITIL